MFRLAPTEEWIRVASLRRGAATLRANALESLAEPLADHWSAECDRAAAAVLDEIAAEADAHCESGPLERQRLRV